MTKSRLYFDYNASAPMRPAATAALLAACDAGNPSSVHAEGRAGRALLEKARTELAVALKTTSSQIVFTSGATEAINMTLRPDTVPKGEGPFDALLIGGGEHPCVFSGHRFAQEQVEIIPLTRAGTLDLVALDSALERRRGQKMLLALQAVNNETGVIQPVNAAAEKVHALGGSLFCDAVQAIGRIPCDFGALAADFLVVSAHKFGGPKGVGALAAVCGGAQPPAFICGGGQERGLRGGTENVVGIAAMGAALSESLAMQESEGLRLAVLRDLIEQGLCALEPDIVLFGTDAPRVANTLAFAPPFGVAEALVVAFDIEGVALSSGSACSSGKVRASHVLGAMNVQKDVAKAALRVSLGWGTTEAECSQFLDIFATLSKRMRKRTLGAIP